MEESGLPGDKAGMRSVYKIMDVSILKLCWWWLEEEACLPTPSPSPEGDLVVAPHYLFIKQGDEGSKGFLRFFSYPRSAFTSYWDVCFHFKVNFWNFFLLWSGPEGFVISFRKGKAKPKTFPLRSSHYFQLFQVPWMSPGNVTPSLWGGLVALGWDLFFFSPPFFLFFSLWSSEGLVIISLMHCKSLLSGFGWFLPERMESVPSRSQRNPFRLAVSPGSPRLFRLLHLCVRPS